MSRIAVVAAIVVTSAGMSNSAMAKADELRCADSVQRYQPPHGIVASESVALQIARIYLSAIYGDQQIKSEMPLKADPRGVVWHVEGTLKPGWEGGIAEIDICRSNGRVLSVIHGK